MRTFVYVDGFNLYYRALRNTPYRWLDLSKLASLLLPKDNIHHIHYYTASIVARPGDPDQPTKMPLASDPTKVVEVLRTDEKGSDVNLATHLVYEAMRDEYDTQERGHPFPCQASDAGVASVP